MTDIPKRPDPEQYSDTGELYRRAYWWDKDKHEHAVAKAAVEALRKISNDTSGTGRDWILAQKTLRTIEESGWRDE